MAQDFTLVEPSTKKGFKIPVEGAAPVTHAQGDKTFRIPVDPVGSAPAPRTDQKLEELNQPKGPDMIRGLTVQAYEPTWWQRVKATVGRHGLEGAWQNFEKAHTATGDWTGALHVALNSPTVALGELFPNNPATKVGQMAKGAADAISGFTTPGQLALMAAGGAEGLLAKGSEVLPLMFKAIGTAMLPTMGVGTAQSIQEIREAKRSGDTEAENEAWGGLLANIGSVLIPHLAGKAAEHFTADTRMLDEHAQSAYKKPFASLTDEQKTHVMYNAIEDASPKFRKRVQQEVDRINQKAGRKPAAAGEPVSEEEQNARFEAQRRVMDRIIASRQRAEVARREAARREDEARTAIYQRQQEADRAAREAEQAARTAEGAPKSPVVEDKRILAERGERGVLWTTEREGSMFNPEPEPEKPLAEDRRFWIGDRDLTPARAAAAEKPVQEFAEQRMGQSFSSLPLARQHVIARYFERFQPDQWKAFQDTAAYATYQHRARIVRESDAMLKPYLERNGFGENTPLAPGADLPAGLARLILSRTKIENSLAADPATHRALNESAETNLGQSFDALGSEDRTSALVEYLRQYPDKVGAFLTPDLAARIQTGQHIDLANLEAELRDREQAQVLMEHRDAIRREMEAQAAQKLIQDERARHHGQLADAIRQARTTETASLEGVDEAARGLIPMAERLNLGQVSGPEDLFRAEDDLQRVPPADRTPEMSQFLTRMRGVRAAAEDHVLREMAESTAAKFRADRETATESAAREVIRFTSDAADLRRAADELAKGNAEQREEAKTVRDTAQFLDSQANAIVAGAETVHTPAPERPAVRREVPMAAGRETRVVYPAKEAGAAAHYAIVDAGELQTSHLPLTYQERPGYNQAGQPRKYDINRTAQAAIEARAGNLDTDILLSNDPQATGGPPVADQRLHVISGNGRSLYLLTALERSPAQYAKYLRELHDRAPGFGINPAELTKFRNPVLVKVLDAPVGSETEWARLGREMNVDPTMGMSSEEMGVALARLLTPDNTERLAGIIDSLPTLDDKGNALTVREAMRARSGEIAQLLLDTGVVPAHKAEEYLKEGELTGKAKDLFEGMLTGVTVSDPAVLADASASVKDKLARAGIYFVQAKGAGENWNLASYNTDAVDLLNRAQSARARLEDLVGRERAARQAKDGRREGQDVSRATGRDESLVEKYLHPERYLDALDSFAFDDQPLHEAVHPAVEALAMALEEPPKVYAGILAKYAREAKNGGETLYGTSDPADVFTNNIASKYGLKVEPEAWGRVAPLPEAVAVSLENSRGPLPVEPEVSDEAVIHSIIPDPSSVEDTLKGTPRTVNELRHALATHEGIGAEQADALTQMFEDVLPRAIGEDFGTLLGNRRLSFAVGGRDGEARGYHEMVEDGKAIIRLCDSADTSTFLHEMAHYLRQYLRPDDQKTANEFVGAKPGQSWTEAQEEKFAQAFERYHYDGGIRRGKLEQVFATLSRAMQSVYNAVTGRKLAKGTPELEAMFDRWYDWHRSERKPITKRLDVDALEAAAKEVLIPDGARVIDGRGTPSEAAKNFVFLSRDDARNFLTNSKNGVRAWEMHQVKGEDTVYVRADTKKGKRLRQPGLDDVVTLARRARDLEQQLKRTSDPREQARLRGVLNGVEDRLRGSTFVIGGKPEPPDTSATQLIYGASEMPTLAEPTSPAQASAVQQAMGDPTAVSLGGEHGRPRAVPDESAGVRHAGEAGGLDEPPGTAHGEHGAPGPELPGHGATRRGNRADLARPAVAPLSRVKGASLMAPERPRGTPVVDPAIWREHVEALGLPEGTPPPTLRVDPAIRQMMIYPGQAEAIEGVLSALQQHDGTILAAPTGSGKTVMLCAVAQHLLGDSGDKVGLIVTRSANLIHGPDGYMEWGRRVGTQIDHLPKNMNEVQSGGVYAATYSKIRGARDVFSIPWDFVLFDESAEARNWTESDQGKAVVMLGHAANKVVYASATPYHTTMELGYMHKLGLWPQGGFTEWASQFGLREIGPNTFSGGAAAAKLEKLRQQLIERGQWQTLYKDMDGVQAHVAMVPNTPEVKQGIRNIRAAFAMGARGFQKAGLSRYLTPTAGHEAIYLKRYIEGARLPQVIELTKKAIDNGWSPIIFSEYRSGAEEGMDFFRHLPGDLGKRVNAMLPPLPDVVAALRKEFGSKIGIFAGEENQLRAEELEGFMDGTKDAVYMTYAAGGVGANAQDKVGDRPRMGIYLGLPWSGIMFEQATGRPWRYGTKSDVANIFLTSDALPEMKVLATKILPRMRALKAAVYGERIESQLSKDLRESVGIPEEMLQYEQGQEYKPEAAQFEQEGEGARYTHIDDLELPDAKKAMNRGMKYKGGKKLYQGPKDEGDPFRKAAMDSWNDLMKRMGEQPAPVEGAMRTNAPIMVTAAADAGREAMGTGEPAERAVQRKMRDMENGALLWWDDAKEHSKAAGHFLRENLWMFGTSGDQAMRKLFASHGMAKEGAEIQRRMIDYDIRSGNYRGEFGGQVAKIIHENRLTPPEHELVTKVVEGTGHSDDPRILKAADDYRRFFAGVRKRLADAGLVVQFFDDAGKKTSVPFSKMADDPHYWPRIYDWNKKFVVRGDNGERIVTSLGEIMHMPKGSERRERLIEKVAEQRGISKIQAQAFFDSHARGVRLAGNIERAREFDIPLYGRDRKAIERYVNEVAEKLAAAEVHGQFREKTDPILDTLPTSHDRDIANRILTADLDPARLHDADRWALRAANRWLVLSKMSLSALKLPFHIAKTSMVANTRSVAAAIVEGAMHPREVFQNASDCGAMVDYMRTAWLREYGLQNRGLDQKLLDFNGFTFLMYASRVWASAAGRLWLEKYAYPELAKNPKDAALRRKLTDLYGYSDEQLDRLAAEGPKPEDVKRASLAAANWTTGSGRPTELPPALRGYSGDPLAQRFTTLLRIAQSLHGFMFKTANLVNRTVWHELLQSDWKSERPYHLIGRFAANFGLAGWALNEILYLRHKMSGSPEADMEDRRREWLEAHPLSKEALFYALSDISMGMGLQVVDQLTQELATQNPKDRAKMIRQQRVLNSATDLVLGVAARDIYNAAKAVNDYRTTFEDTGNHRKSPEERRADILRYLTETEVPLSRYVEHPAPAPPRVAHPRRRRASTVLQ